MAMLIATSGWAYDELDLIKFKSINKCEGCDLSGADLSKLDLYNADLQNANLTNANLSKTNLTNVDLSKAKSIKNITLRDAIYCNTTMPWGVLNDGCKDDE
tara:strand:+ start:10289 stop:10591 length:303 start_codon:yes stop_codon:yes gene_type:complete